MDLNNSLGFRYVATSSGPPDFPAYVYVSGGMTRAIWRTQCGENVCWAWGVHFARWGQLTASNLQVKVTNNNLDPYSEWPAETGPIVPDPSTAFLYPCPAGSTAAAYAGAFNL